MSDKRVLILRSCERREAKRSYDAARRLGIGDQLRARQRERYAATNTSKRADPIEMGQQFARLTVVQKAESKARSAHWLCQCVCGSFVSVAASSLRSGNTKSCGCLHTETVRSLRKTHGMTGSKTYWAWGRMVQRCTNPNVEKYGDYGGRGIAVCERWSMFARFWDDMGECPPGMSLERKDVNGDYSPGNFEWIPIGRQQRNKRNTRLVDIDGKTKSLVEWCEDFGAVYSRARDRLNRGWDAKLALMTP